MAITKILSLNMSKTGDSASHLLNSLHYIVDVEKTEEHALVGSINCLPIADLAYKQMVETKKFFGKQTGRQGIRSSFPLKRERRHRMSLFRSQGSLRNNT